VATVANGDGGEYAHYLRDRSGAWRQVTKFEDKITRVAFGRDPLYIEAGKDNALYCLSHKDAPTGRILRLPLAQPDLANAHLIIGERTNVIHDLKPAASGLFLALLNGGPSELAFFDYTEKTISRPRDEDRVGSSIEEMLVTKGDEVLYRTASYTRPFA